MRNEAENISVFAFVLLCIAEFSPISRVQNIDWKRDLYPIITPGTGRSRSRQARKESELGSVEYSYQLEN